MRNRLFILFLCITTLPAFGININSGTQIEWNSNVVVDAIKLAGLESKTSNRILVDLLDRNQFSVLDAVSVCKTYCNQSKNLNLYSTNIDCPAVCEKFGLNLVAENNKKVPVLQQNTATLLAVNNDTNEVVVPEQITQTIPKGDDEVSEEDLFTEIDEIIAKYGEKYGVSEKSVLKESKETAKKNQNANAESYTEYADMYNDLGDTISKCNDYVKQVTNDFLVPLELFSYDAKDDIRRDLEEVRRLEKEYKTFKFNEYDKLEELRRLYYSKKVWGEDCQFLLAKAKEEISAVEDFFAVPPVRKFIDTQVSSLQKAEQLVQNEFKRYIEKKSNKVNYPDISLLKCTGKCNRMPGSQDFVTCTFGTFSATFEFDDICDRTKK